MITILSASNRKENLTSIFSLWCKNYMEEKNIAHQFFSLEDIPLEAKFTELYDHQDSSFATIGEQYIQDSDKFLFLIPEYNGSYPGVLKAFVDAIPPAFFSGKKAALIGLASGHAGNLRGMDHFADVLNYLNVTVYPKKLSIPRIDGLIKGQNIDSAVTTAAMEKQILQLIKF